MIDTYGKLLDHHHVLHLGRADDPIGMALCGHPPVNCSMADPIVGAWGPGEHVNLPFDLICPICNYRAV